MKNSTKFVCVRIGPKTFLNPTHICSLVDARDYIRIKTVNGDEFRAYTNQPIDEFVEMLTGNKPQPQPEIDVEEIRDLMKRVEELIMAIGSDGVGALPDSILVTAANLQIALTKVIVALPKEESVKNGNDS